MPKTDRTATVSLWPDGCLVATPALADKRVALVIGNSAYDNLLLA